MLAIQQERYANGEKHLSAFDTIKLLTPLKKEPEYEWLSEVSNSSLQTVCRDLGEAYSRFFKKAANKPRFKSRKRAKSNFPIRCDAFHFVTERLVQIPKLGKVKYKTDFDLPLGHDVRFSNRVSRTQTVSGCCPLVWSARTKRFSYPTRIWV